MKISFYKLKRNCFIYEMCYVNLMLTTRQKLRAAALKIKVEETEQNTMENHQLTKLDGNKGEKKQWKYKTTRRQFR